MPETRDPFGFDPAHITELRVEWASDRDIPADWPSQIVRRAADLMKQRAADTTGERWHTESPAGRGPGGIPWPATYVVADADALRFRTYSVEDAAHVAALDPTVATAIAEAWEHQADDMGDHLAHLHACAGEPGYVVQDEREIDHYDWTATLRAALAYLREDAPKAVGSDG